MKALCGILPFIWTKGVCSMKSFILRSLLVCTQIMEFGFVSSILSRIWFLIWSHFSWARIKRGSSRCRFLSRRVFSRFTSLKIRFGSRRRNTLSPFSPSISNLMNLSLFCLNESRVQPFSFMKPSVSVSARCSFPWRWMKVFLESQKAFMSINMALLDANSSESTFDMIIMAQEKLFSKSSIGMATALEFIGSLTIYFQSFIQLTTTRCHQFFSFASNQRETEVMIAHHFSSSSRNLFSVWLLLIDNGLQ
ncbi:MAG: hypothetical protein ACD_2C00176G0001 [uncultured bacterium (gcode 4)]|uniref:Uncharacterized protein n=1 Tax=uncultured bacterium (gcode 4) TaxID=1234023 RepID=K2H0S7_9BACT|nr:MAG: hypothetical protein ACD_2C00176G0001 [uncultured bacterium (gcode 4)]